MKKKCPVLMLNYVQHSSQTECLEDECAWWIELIYVNSIDDERAISGHCAILDISK